MAAVRLVVCGWLICYKRVMPLSNYQIAKILSEIAMFLEMDRVNFKPQAYQQAARVVADLDIPLWQIYQKEGINGLKNIEGVGESIAKKIAELLETGKLRYYQDYRRKYPIDVLELSSIEGVGPRLISILYDKLGIKTVEDLAKAAKSGKLRRLEHFGERSEEKILKGIEFLKRSQGRFILGFIEPFVQRLVKKLEKTAGVKKVEVCGSYRRREETIGDIDILVLTAKPRKAIESFVGFPEVIHVYAKGSAKANVRLSQEIDADLRVISPESWGAALQYFTGSKAHNIALRKMAERKGWKLNEYGLFDGEKRIAGRDEEEIYKKLGLRYIPPELRSDQGEIEAAKNNALPRLVPYDSLKGDLQIQTNWSDGTHSIQEMAEEAMSIGLEYIAITDHSQSLGVASGLKPERLKKQWAEIERFNKRLRQSGKNFQILKASEVNILKDGSLDYPDDILAAADLILAAIHDHFRLSRLQQTKRMIRAIEHPFVDIIGHPTGRIVGRRDAYELDMEAVLQAAAKTGTIMEINAFPTRLDLKDIHIRMGHDFGVSFTINTDAHDRQHLHFLNYGIAQARRGWTTRQAVLNTMALKDFLKYLKRNKIQRRGGLGT